MPFSPGLIPHNSLLSHPHHLLLTQPFEGNLQSIDARRPTLPVWGTCLRMRNKVIKRNKLPTPGRLPSFRGALYGEPCHPVTREKACIPSNTKSNKGRRLVAECGFRDRLGNVVGSWSLGRLPGRAPGEGRAGQQAHITELPDPGLAERLSHGSEA